MHYIDLLLLSGNFIALDISVRSTGWVRYCDKRLDYGTFGLRSSDDRARRREFSEFIIQLIQGYKYECIAVEDIIFGNNFRTTKALMQLNIVPETLMDYGKLPEIPIRRIGNSVWKHRLRQLAPAGTVLDGEDDKTKIRCILHLLGFNAGRKALAQDIYDAMGLGLARIAEDHLPEKPDTVLEAHNLHTDLYKCYKLAQYPDEETLARDVSIRQHRSRKERRIIWLRSCDEYNTVDKHFKRTVEEQGEQNIFAFVYDVRKVGALLLRKQFDSRLISNDTVFFSAVL